MNQLTILEGLEGLLDLLTSLALLGHFLAEELARSDAFPTELVCDEGGVFLTETSGGTH